MRSAPSTRSAVRMAAVFSWSWAKSAMSMRATLAGAGWALALVLGSSFLDAAGLAVASSFLAILAQVS